MRKRIRELGIEIGGMQPGAHNSITDVPGVELNVEAGRTTDFELTDVANLKTQLDAEKIARAKRENDLNNIIEDLRDEIECLEDNGGNPAVC